MESRPTAVPGGHTPDGGVLLGGESVRHRLILFEDPQCPYCRQFEEVSGDLIRGEVTAGAISVEYRMRCFLGVESVRANNSLALAAEEDRFDDLRRLLFAEQPEENSGGFAVADLIDLGKRAGVSSSDYVRGVQDGRDAQWVVEVEQVFQEQDPQGTPAALFDGQPIDTQVLGDAERLGALLRG
jgi:hypothetical protein